MKSSWNSGKTATMRVPITLKKDLMHIARHLDEGGGINLVGDKNFENILSQEKKSKIIALLRQGISSKKQGGVYNSSNASTLKKQVLKALEILEL